MGGYAKIQSATQSNMGTYTENVFLPFGKNALSTLAFSFNVQRLRGSKRSSAFFVRGSVWAAHFFIVEVRRENFVVALHRRLNKENDLNQRRLVVS